MTLQEAKDQAAREFGIDVLGNDSLSWDDIKYIPMTPKDEEGIYNRFGELMYDAGKKESDTYRKALEAISSRDVQFTIRTEYDSGYSDSSMEAAKIAKEALKS